MMVDPTMSPAQTLDGRSQSKVTGVFTIDTILDHFALITYAVPPDRLRQLIHPSFDLHTLTIEGQEKALLSVVPFLDRDFGFQHLPGPRFSFVQTNYRIYVRNRGEECAWYLGTTLASTVVAVPRIFWRLPWYAARSTLETHYNASEHRYERYHLRTESKWGDAEVRLTDTGQPPGLLPGFTDQALQKLVLTHPVAGFFWMTNQKLGTYQIWHDQMKLTVGGVVAARFGLLERLRILTPDEMLHPHSVLLQPAIPFLVGVPPREVRLTSDLPRTIL